MHSCRLHKTILLSPPALLSGLDIMNLKKALTFRKVAKNFPRELQRIMLAEGSPFGRWKLSIAGLKMPIVNHRPHLHRKVFCQIFFVDAPFVCK